MYFGIFSVKQAEKSWKVEHINYEGKNEKASDEQKNRNEIGLNEEKNCSAVLFAINYYQQKKTNPIPPNSKPRTKMVKNKIHLHPLKIYNENYTSATSTISRLRVEIQEIQPMFVFLKFCSFLRYVHGRAMDGVFNR